MTGQKKKKKRKTPNKFLLGIQGVAHWGLLQCESMSCQCFINRQSVLLQKIDGYVNGSY